MTEGAPKGLQDSSVDFLELLGICISTWADVDEALFAIFQECVGPPEQCAIIYSRSPGLNIRLGLTSEIVLSVLPKKIRKNGGHDHFSVIAWRKTIENMEKLLGIRRRLAHQPVKFRISTAYLTGSSLIGQATLGEPIFPKGIEPPQTWFGIYEAHHENLRAGTIPKPLEKDDLLEHMQEVWALKLRLTSFFNDVLLKRHEASFVSAAQQEPDASKRRD